MIEIGRYQRGDLALVKCAEPDPIEDWPAVMEASAHDIRSVRLDGRLVGCIGYVPFNYTEADAFAIVDRDAVQGHGRQLSMLIRKQQLAWMDHIGVTSALASCSADDRAAQVFLRAIGYRRISSESPDIANFEFKRGTNHG